MERAKRRRAFGRALRAPITDEAVEHLQEMLLGFKARGKASAVCEDGAPDLAAGPAGSNKRRHREGP
jgi:hypothetical protein